MSSRPEAVHLPDQAQGDLAAEIVHALYETCSKLGAKSDLLCILGSFRDTMGDRDVLDELRAWNDEQPTFKHIVECVKTGSEECTACRDRDACSLAGGGETSLQAQ